MLILMPEVWKSHSFFRVRVCTLLPTRCILRDCKCSSYGTRCCLSKRRPRICLMGLSAKLLAAFCTMAVSSGTVALVACGLLHSLGMPPPMLLPILLLSPSIMLPPPIPLFPSVLLQPPLLKLALLPSPMLLPPPLLHPALVLPPPSPLLPPMLLHPLL